MHLRPVRRRSPLSSGPSTRGLVLPRIHFTPNAFIFISAFGIGRAISDRDLAMLAGCFNHCHEVHVDSELPRGSSQV